MNNLFPDRFQVVRTDDELASVLSVYPTYDPYYVASGCILDRKIKFNKLWSKYKHYCDKHFLKQIKYDFHARTWEMYLGVLLMQNGIIIQALDNGPDIKMILENKHIWIEAVVAKKGTGRDAVPDVRSGRVYDIPHDEMLIRLLNSLAYKFDKYLEYIKKGIVKDNEPYIIAVNTGILGYPDPEVPLIFKCLFGLGYLTLSFTISDGKRQPPYMSHRKFVQKKDGTEIPLDFFNNPKHSGISAIIYSTQNILNHPAILGRDCLIVHNPNATNLIDPRAFRFIEQWRRDKNQIVKIKEW